jgi:hypothetical protein
VLFVLGLLCCSLTVGCSADLTWAVPLVLCCFVFM